MPPRWTLHTRWDGSPRRHKLAARSRPLHHFGSLVLYAMLGLGLWSVACERPERLHGWQPLVLTVVMDSGRCRHCQKEIVLRRQGQGNDVMWRIFSALG